MFFQAQTSSGLQANLPQSDHGQESRGPSPSYPAAIHWPPKHTIWFLYSAVSLRLSSYSLGLVRSSPPLKIPRWKSISSSRSRINISLDVKFPLNPWFIWIDRPPGLPSYKEHLVTYPSLPHPWKWHFSPCACLMVKSEGRESGLPRQLIKHCFWARLWGCFQKTLSFHSLLLSFLSIVGHREIKWYLLLHLLSKITWPSKSTLFLAMFMACDKVNWQIKICCGLGIAPKFEYWKLNPPRVWGAGHRDMELGHVDRALMNGLIFPGWGPYLENW